MGRTPTTEQSALLNRSFCATLLWYAAAGYSSESEAMSNDAAPALPFELSYLILPIVLPRLCRESLPNRVDSSLGAWLADRPLVVAQFSSRARALSPHSRTALAFAFSYGIIRLEAGMLYDDHKLSAQIKKVTKQSSKEVQACIKKAFFIGRWFARSGTSATIMTHWGVRP